MVKKLGSTMKIGSSTDYEESMKAQGYQPTRSEVKAYEAQMYDTPKKTTKSKIEKLLKEITETEIHKPKKGTKNISMIMDLARDISKTPKHKKIDTEGIDDQIKEVEKLLKAKPKALKKLVKADKEHIKYHPSDMDKKELNLDTKIMNQSKGYKHKLDNVSPAVKNYVDYYIDIYKNSKTPQSRSKKLNALKVMHYTNLRPSDADDANALISEFKKTLEPVIKTKGVTKQSSASDKKYKSVTEYVKKNKPSVKDVDDLHIIVTELIDKDKRMSKKLLDEVFKDLEITGSGLRKRKMKGGRVKSNINVQDLIPDDNDETDDEQIGDVLEAEAMAEHLLANPVVGHIPEHTHYDLFEQISEPLSDTGYISKIDVFNFPVFENQNPRDFYKSCLDVTNKLYGENHSNDTSYYTDLEIKNAIDQLNNYLLDDSIDINDRARFMKAIINQFRPKSQDMSRKDLKRHRDEPDDNDRHGHTPLLGHGLRKKK
jgi:hypothetical protein